MSVINHIKLSELNAKIYETIENAFSNNFYWIIADVTNHSFKEKSNYHYFELVEKDTDSNEIIAKISGKGWGTGSIKIRNFEQVTGQKFTNNISVLIQVRVNYHKVFGLSVDILEIDTNFTLGVLEQQRQATLLKLLTDNPEVVQKMGDKYITRNSKLPLPSVIQTIAVISSKTSAGNEDFKHTLQHNTYGYKFRIDDYNTVVQNEANWKQFLDTVIAVFNSKIQYDVVVINRGGGAQSDFLIFDNYNIGRAIARFPMPIITGIGHQKNETIADLMAHTSTKTPTKAAEFIITHNRNFEDSILFFQKKIIIKSQQLFSRHYQALSQLNSTIVNTTRTFLNDYKDTLYNVNSIVINKTKSLIFQHNNSLNKISSQLITNPKITIYNRLNDLSKTASIFKTYSNSFLKNKRAYLGHYVSVINLMSPINILKKGFAYIKLNDKITSDPDEIKRGSQIEIVLSGSSIQSTVTSKTEYNGNDFNL